MPGAHLHRVSTIGCSLNQSGPLSNGTRVLPVHGGERTDFLWEKDARVKGTRFSASRRRVVGEASGGTFTRAEMVLSESELNSDLEPESDNSRVDEDYTPRRVTRGSKKEFSEEDTSDEEWISLPRRRRATRKRLLSATTVSPLKSPSKKCPQGPNTKRNHCASPHKKATPSPNARKRLSTPSRKNKGGARRAERSPVGKEDDVSRDRWRSVEEEDTEPPQPRFRPERDAGPQLNITANYTPLELFQLFFSKKVIDTLVSNTNAYGAKKHQSQRESWVPITAADMHSFICLVLYMGIVPLKTLREFWRGSRLFSLPFPGSVMPSRRFLAISSSLHMNDPEVEAANEQKKGTAEYDRLCKIKPLYEQILEACQTFFHPYQHISIDERMVPTKARISFKQYIKNKPTKWGFKLFVLADSSCGYTLNFFVYGGKEGEPTGKGLGYDVVMRLLNIPFLGKGYKLYVDNFYTSPTLFSDLLKRKIWACGTIRSNIDGYPRTINNDMPKKAPRGTIQWLRKEQLLFVRWLDTRQVTMCSTIHKAYSNDTAERKMKTADGQWTVKQVPVPCCIKDYNRYMGGVDLSDALIGYYNVIHKTQRWYKTLFYHFVDIATVNAFILHKEMCRRQSRPIITQKNFREQLILSLAAIGSTPGRAPPQNFMLPITPIKVPPASPSPVCPSEPPPPPSHAPSFGHLPSYFVEQMSNVAPRNRATAGRRACVVCKRKSPVYCSTCQKTLCFTSLRNCYSEWHRRNSICV